MRRLARLEWNQWVAAGDDRTFGEWREAFPCTRVIHGCMPSETWRDAKTVWCACSWQPGRGWACQCPDTKPRNCQVHQ